MEKKPFELKPLNVTPNVNFLTTLRNSGYNNYTAIADIVDNSLDTNVGSENINILIKKNKEDYESIFICDDGCGMNITTLNEAFKLGAITGKIKKLDLGVYGTGLKAAALSLGRRFEIQTKSDDDLFYIATYDLDEITSSGNFEIPIRYGSDLEFENFKNLTNSETGTIVILQKLDRISNSNITQFRNKLAKDFGLFYKIFIDEYGVNIKFDNVIVESIDPMYRVNKFVKRLSSLNEKFIYSNKEFVFNVFYIDKIDKTINNKLEFSRNYTNRGLYIYRNNRLVGSGLDLGIINKYGDGYYNGLRIELFIDGDSDDLFGSTFMKMIHERDKEEVNQGFRDACNKALSQYIRMVYSEERSGTSNEINEDTKDEFKKLVDDINKNKLVKVKKVGGNEKKDNEKPEHEPTGRKNKFSPRKREDVFTDWKFVNLGEGGNLFNVSKDNGKYVVHMNIDHVFWKEFLNKATNETKGILTRLFVSMAISLDSIGFYDDTEKESLLQEYLLEMSTNLRKLIIG